MDNIYIYIYIYIYTHTHSHNIHIHIQINYIIHFASVMNTLHNLYISCQCPHQIGTTGCLRELRPCSNKMIIIVIIFSALKYPWLSTFSILTLSAASVFDRCQRRGIEFHHYLNFLAKLHRFRFPWSWSGLFPDKATVNREECRRLKICGGSVLLTYDMMKKYDFQLSMSFTKKSGIV